VFNEWDAADQHPRARTSRLISWDQVTDEDTQHASCHVIRYAPVADMPQWDVDAESAVGRRIPPGCSPRLSDRRLSKCRSALPLGLRALADRGRRTAHPGMTRPTSSRRHGQPARHCLHRPAQTHYGRVVLRLQNGCNGIGACPTGSCGREGTSVQIAGRTAHYAMFKPAVFEPDRARAWRCSKTAPLGGPARHHGGYFDVTGAGAGASTGGAITGAGATGATGAWTGAGAIATGGATGAGGATTACGAAGAPGSE
jgi:hypothetical protein